MLGAALFFHVFLAGLSGLHFFLGASFPGARCAHPRQPSRRPCGPYGASLVGKDRFSPSDTVFIYSPQG